MATTATQDMDVPYHVSANGIQHPTSLFINGEAKLHEPSHKRSEKGAFFRWRPSYHLMAPHGWMNDPCAPGYDPSTGLYHVAFQWNPKGNDWDEGIAWGHSESRDLVSWKTAKMTCLTPDTHYDRCGVFTGCFRPTGINGETDGTLSYIYTSVNKLPIHHTLTYTEGSESLSLATSTDGGRSWEKFPDNPILMAPPSDIEVTGWRDPFVAPWPSLSAALGHKADEYMYGIISGGIVNKTPTTFIYSILAKDLSKWEYLGPLMTVGLNHKLSRWSGDLGVNWEVSNFMTLSDQDGVSRDILVVGAEGGLPVHVPKASGENQALTGGDFTRAPLWMMGQLRGINRDGRLVPEMQYEFGGVLDFGCFYAANSFWDPVSKERILWGWITEDDLPNKLRHHQNWSGLLSLPRIVRLKSVHHVKNARVSNLKSITSVETELDEHGTYTVRTLETMPDKRLESLRIGARKLELHLSPVKMDASLAGSNVLSEYLDIRTLHWELECSFTVGKSCNSVGIVIGHSVGE